MMPACSVPGCVDPAEVRVSMAYGSTVYLCARHGREVRRVILEIVRSAAPRRAVAEAST
jgi:hypothetical protein